MWKRLCRAIDAPALLENPQYATAAARLKNRDALNAEIESYLADRTSAEWVERMNAAGVPCGPIYAIDKVFADPQVEHLGVVQDVETADERGMLHLVGQPVTLARTPSRLVAPPPERGEHTEEVLREFGFTDAEIAEPAQGQGDLSALAFLLRSHARASGHPRYIWRGTARVARVLACAGIGCACLRFVCDRLLWRTPNTAALARRRLREPRRDRGRRACAAP